MTDHLMGMQLEASYRREVAHRWATQRNLRRMVGARERRDAPPRANRPPSRRVPLGQQVMLWLWRHARRAATT
jgi:hypothetical protein